MMKISKSELKQIIKEELEATMDEGFLNKVYDRMAGLDKIDRSISVHHWPIPPEGRGLDGPPKVYSAQDIKNPRKFEVGPITITRDGKTSNGGHKVQIRGEPLRFGKIHYDKATGWWRVEWTSSDPEDLHGIRSYTKE